jgi:hypothetical protein
MAEVSFRRWLRQFAAEESEIGDLARDVHADPNLATGTGFARSVQDLPE